MATELLYATAHHVELVGSASITNPQLARDQDPATFADLWCPNAGDGCSERIDGFPAGSIAPAMRARVLLSVKEAWQGVPDSLGSLWIEVNGGGAVLLASYLWGVGWDGSVKLFDITALCAGETLDTVQVFCQLNRNTAQNPPAPIVHGA